MPVLDVKGLPGLRGWRDLSIEEKQQWLQANPKARGASMYQLERAYETSQFINEFGNDALQANNLATRRQMMRDKVIGDKFEEVYGKDDDFAELNNMTTTGKERALSLGLANKEEIEESADIKADLISPVRRNAFDFMNASSATGFVGIRTQGKIKDIATEGSALFNNGIKGRDELKKKILAEDNILKQKTADKFFKNYRGSINNALNNGEISTQQVDEIFNSIVKGGKKTETLPGIGEVSIDLPGSRYYDAFKNSHWFNDFSLQEKVDVIAKYNAMKDAFGLADAIDTTDRNMQQRVADKQGVIRQLGNTFANINTGAIAYIMQSLMAFDSMSKLGDAKAFANFQEGLDKDGNKLPNIWNIKYWDGVDQFGTFDESEINDARARGGISAMQLITPPGKEYGVWPTINEGLNMMKFVIPDMLLNGALGKLGSTTAKLAGAKFTPIGTLAGNSTKAGAAIAKYVNPTVMAFRSGLGIAQAYSTQTYDQTLADANQLVDSQVSKDAGDYAKSIMDSDTGKQAINTYVDAQLSQIKASYPSLGETELKKYRELLTEQGASLYEDKLKQDYIMNKDLWAHDYNADREEARRQAGAAAVTDFIIEQARMFAAGMTWRNYTFDPGTRRMMQDNFPGYKLVNTANKEIGVTNRHWARIKPMAARVWGGFESNYFDDVTVAFGKGFGLGKFNNYLAHKYNPEQDAETIDAVSNFFTGISGAVSGAKESLTEFQSFYDGLVGALGTVTQAVPRVGNIMKKSTWQNFRTDEYGNRITIAESLNKILMNPLLEAYSDARARERQLDKTVDAINKDIADNDLAVNDILSLIGSSMDVINLTDNATSAREIKDAKVRQAYTAALWLNRAMNDPIMSQHDGVQGAQSTLERLAKGDITQEDIATFLGRPEGKSLAELPNGEGAEIAKTRLRDNAQQLLNYQRTYNNIADDIKGSDLYNTLLAQSVSDRAIQDITEQLAFMRIAGQDWEKRRAEMEKEISGSNISNTTRNRTARYGTRKGWERAVEEAEEQVNDLQHEYDIYKQLYDRAVGKRVKGTTIEERRAEAAPLRLTAENIKTLLDQAKEELKTIKAEEVKEGEVLPVLSKEEILNLNPEERAYMLRTKNVKGKTILENQSEYTKEQQKVINDVRNDLNMRDTSLWGKVQDVAELDWMIKDNAKAYGLISDNPMAAAHMVDNLRENRQGAVIRRIELRNWDRQDAKMESIEDEDALISEAKTTNARYLQRYIDKHPDSKGTLSNVIDILKLSNDAAKVIDGIFEDEADRANWKESISAQLFNPEVKTVDDAMEILEQQIDAQELEANKNNLNKILEGLTDLHYQRNATVIQNREEARREAERKKAEQEFNSDGKNFGFDGYKVGDVLYDKKTKSPYTISKFTKNEDGTTTMSVVSQGNGHTYNHTVETSNKKFTKDWGEAVIDTIKEGSLEKNPKEETINSKTPQEVKKDDETPGKPVSTETQTPPVTPQPQTESPAQASDFTPEGAVVQGTEDEQAKQDASTAGTQVIPQGTQDPYTSPVQPYEEDSGTFPGNVLGEYDLASLENTAFKKVKKKVPANQGDLLSQWFEWLSGNKTNLQEIIDYEFGRIIQDHPDTKVHFMKIRSKEGNSLQDKVIVNVIELTEELKKYHNEDRGGVVTVDGKNYLVVGTSGFRPRSSLQRTTFNKLNYRLNQAANQYFIANQASGYYVSDAYSQVSDILNGKFANALANDEDAQYRTITELMNDPARNPRGYKSLQDLVFGVLYNSGLVTSKNVEGLKFYPPSNSRIGNTFVFVETANGAWVPIEIRTVDFTQLREGRLKDTITGLYTDLVSNDIQTRRDAAKRLFGKEYGYLLTDDTHNVLVGDEEHNNITVINEGQRKTYNLSNFDRADFMGTISAVPFVIKTKMATFTDIDRLEMYDEAGALTTNSALLGTVNQTYNLWNVKEDGTPDIRPEKQVFTKQEPVGRKTFLSTSLRGKIYRMSINDGVYTYYDENGREIPQTEENRPFLTDIHYNILIQTKKLSPIKDKKNKGVYFVIRSTNESPLAVHRTHDGNIMILNKAQSRKVIQYEAQQRADEERKANAKAELERVKQEGKVVAGKSYQSGEAAAVSLGELQGLNEQQPVQQPTQAPEIKPVTKAEEVITPKEKEESKRVATNNSEGSLEELENRAQNSGESVTFEIAWNSKFEVIASELERITGKEPEDESEAKEMFEKLGLPTTDINMNTIEDILKNCRRK